MRLTRTLLRAGALGVLVTISAAACAPNRGDGYAEALAKARRAYGAGRFDEAAVAYDDAGRRAKVPRDALFMRYQAALARQEAGDVAGAARELTAIAEARPPNEYSPQAALKLAQLAMRTDRARGHEALARIVTAFPESGSARVAVVRVARWDDEQAGPGAALARLRALEPKVRGTSVEQAVAYEAARRLEALGKDAEARDAYLDVARRWPYPFGVHFDDALFRASEAEERLGQNTAAIAHLERLLSHREVAGFLGSYQRPRYVPALLRIADLYEHRLNDRAKAREALHRLYAEHTTSTLRDDALWREAELWEKDGDRKTACACLETLVSAFPDSRYVPCAALRCPSVRPPPSSRAPRVCRAYLSEQRAGTSP